MALGWVTENGDDLILFIDSANNANSYGSADYDFHFTIAGIDYVAGLHASQSDPSGQLGDGTASPTGVATAAEWQEETRHMMITVPKSAVGSPAAGTVMTNLFLTSSLNVLGEIGAFTDRAPDADFGADYFIGGVPGGDPNDTDGDGLNDTWEMQYFGDLNQTAEDDPDGDGLTNGQEEALGTDPTKADTDGDGCDDNVDSAPLDPDAGCESSSTTTTTTTGTGTSTATGTATGTVTGTATSTRTTTTAAGTAGDGGRGNVENLDDAVERLESDLGYVGLSAGGFLAVLVLCIIGLAVRWSL